MDHIRNFSIIAHIDHGKSTLADRFLEITHTVPAREMRDQVLDRMDLERERGITIKMTPVTMTYPHQGKQYTLNLIDTPGHIDFSYEVSRALTAVEGVILLVDSTKGVQAQTMTVLSQARDAGLAIIPAISKVDAPLARIDAVRAEVARLIGVAPSDVLEVSGKTGQGVEKLLSAVVERIPSPKSSGYTDRVRAIIFDFQYSNHRGVILYLRVFDGRIHAHDELVLASTGVRFAPSIVGILTPGERPASELAAGDIGYVVTGIKEPGVSRVGDTVIAFGSNIPPFSGYREPQPVVWSSVYPESQDDFPELARSLARLRLHDASLSFEEEQSGVLGRGFRCGFLGLLHLEIITERLKREFGLTLVVTLPSVTYEVITFDERREVIYTASRFPDAGTVRSIEEPWVAGMLIAEPRHIGGIMRILYEHEAVVGDTETFGDGRTSIRFEMPLRELYRNFFDAVKSETSGYASLSYEQIGMRSADVVRIDLLVAEERVPAFARVVSRLRAQEEAKALVERLHASLPRQLFVTKIQAAGLGRILSSKTLPAMRKDVTGYLYGGDVTRKMKLLEKQKKGKKRMKERGTVNIPHETFLKMIRPDGN